MNLENIEGALITRLQKHTGPVRGLEFNANSPNLLASGAEDGELCIWDLANPTAPTHFPSLKGVGSGAQGEVSFLSWNRKVQHILASTSYSGTTAMAINRISILVCNLCSGMGLKTPEARYQVWDVRNTISPVKEFIGHSKGLHFKTSNSGLWGAYLLWAIECTGNALTCAKDNRTLCWDTVSGEIVSELPAGTNWNFDVQWSPRTPGVLSASSFDGKIGIYNIEDLMEKTVILALATGQKRVSPSLSKLVESYAELLASQGLLSTAMEYLKLLGTEESSHELAILRDRIYLSGTDKMTEPSSFPFETRELQSEPQYGTDQMGFRAPESSQQYYQENLHHGGPGGPYTDTYQQTANVPYTGTYPSPLVKPFIPSTPPVLRNVEQYQQPPVNPQLYPGVSPAGTHPYQIGGPASVSVGPTPVQPSLVPNVMLPAPATAPAAPPRSFMPVTTPGAPQQAGMSPQVRPQSPTQASQVQPMTAAPAPLPTIQNVDTSNVAAEIRPVIGTLTRLYNETSEALGGARANPAKKREIDDNSRKFGSLFAKLNSGDISPNAASKLVQLCQALDSGDCAAALQIQVGLTTSDWDECSFWLAALKRMIKPRQNMR